MLDEGRRPEDRRCRSRCRGGPGSSSSSASSTPASPPACCAHGSFSTMSIRPGPSLMTASPISGHVPSHDVGDVARRRRPSPSAGLDRHLAEVRRPSRSAGRAGSGAAGSGVSMNPPVPMTLPSEILEHPRVQGVPRSTSMTSSSVTSCVAQPLRIDLHLRHLDPLAPDGDVRDARHAQQAGPDLPVGDHRQVDQVDSVVRGEPDLHDPAGRRQRLAS